MSPEDLKPLLDLIEKKEQGWSDEAIAKEIGVSRSYVAQCLGFLRKIGVPVPTAGKVAINMDELAEFRAWKAAQQTDKSA